MGNEPQEQIERNIAIYNDFKTGMNYVDLVAKYRISSQRLWQIIKREEKRNDDDKDMLSEKRPWLKKAVAKELERQNI